MPENLFLRQRSHRRTTENGNGKINGTIEEGNIAHYKEIAEGLLEVTDSVTLLSAALKLLTKEPDLSPVRLTEEAPLRIRKPKQDKYSLSAGAETIRENIMSRRRPKTEKVHFSTIEQR